MGARRKARELALQMLFENDVAGTDPQEMFRRSADLQKQPVVIDEALEIAKRFSTPRSSQFINGILDGVLKSRPAEEAAP